MRRRWSVGLPMDRDKSGALRGLAGSNPAIPTEEGRLKNKHTGALEHLNTSHSLFLNLTSTITGGVLRKIAGYRTRS